MPRQSKLPWWLKPANRVLAALNRLGLPLGTQHILSIPGRKSGKLRSTPVSLLTVDGQRYIVTGFETQWVKNARAAGWGLLMRGRRQERVALVELPVEERAPILREFPRQVPHGIEFFERLLDLPNDPEAFATAAPRCPVFRIDAFVPSDQPKVRSEQL
jgi:deazaflavin-dependent oxidoreductase (nitroreductase family)